MAYDKKDNECVLFKNEKKTDSDKDQSLPDLTGSGMIDGVEYWLSSWVNTSKGGKRYHKLSFRKKEEQQASSTPSSSGSSAEDEAFF